MNVLLIYPEFPDTFWSFKHALRFIRKKASYPPLGLLTVAALLPKEWNKRLVDVNVSRLTKDDLTWADMVFISGMTVQRDSALQIITRCKEHGIRIVAGGPLFITEPDLFDAVDYLVLGEAEVVLPEFLDDLKKGQARRIYRTTEFADIQDTPIPLWELLNIKGYASMSIQYSRGCPFSCEFCNVTSLFGHRPRTKSAKQITAELDSLYQIGWRGSVFFVDDNLIGNRKHLKNELLPALIEWRKSRVGMPFSTEVSIDLVDDEELMKMMVQVGFDAVFIGIETPDETSLAECSKKQNLHRDLVEDVKRIQRMGIQVQAGFIVGFDNDTFLTFQRLVDFIQKSGIVTAMVGLLQAPIGTKLYERMSLAGRVQHQMSGDNVDGTTNIVPIMNADVLQKGYKSVLHGLYTPKAYYKRIRTFLREYQLPQITVPINFSYAMENAFAFMRSVFRLGILGRERFDYWKLFVWTLICRPRAFPLAIRLAIYGYHFRKICELHVS